MTEGPPRYRFGPRSTRGLIAGWSGGQIAAVAIGAVVALGLIRSVGGLAGAFLAVVAVAAGVAVALFPVAGRPAGSWLPTVSRFVASSVSEGRGLPWRTARRPPRRGPLSRLDVRQETTDSAGELGIVEDEEAATWSAALSVGGEGYALFDEEGRASAVSCWAAVLSAMAGDARGLQRLQWIARTYRPAASELFPARLPTRLDGGYEAFLGEVAPQLWEREVLVVVTMPAPRRGLSPLARPLDEAATAERLALVLRSLAERLAGAGLTASPPLSRQELVAAVRRGYDAEPGYGLGAWPWPLGVEAGWSELRTDATWQVTYWISEWPRGEVGPGILLPLLVGGNQRRTVSLTMAPLAASSAVRRAEHERTSGAADADLRLRHGFAVTARARTEQEIALQREAELAAGHAAYLFSGYVAVTAADGDSLEEACAEIEQAAALCQLELRRVYGAQEEAWCCTLPLGRGCR